VILSSSAYKYQRRNQQPGGKILGEQKTGGDDFLRKRGTPGGNFGEGEGGRNRRKEAETGGAGKIF
jgi:hypothetical protein